MGWDWVNDLFKSIGSKFYTIDNQYHNQPAMSESNVTKVCERVFHSSVA